MIFDLMVASWQKLLESLNIKSLNLIGKRLVSKSCGFTDDYRMIG